MDEEPESFSCPTPLLHLLIVNTYGMNELLGEIWWKLVWIVCVFAGVGLLIVAAKSVPYISLQDLV